MGRKISYEKIFTPQGQLGDVSKNPNLDFLMNIFNIPRIYSVSGFGSWNVGQHTVATAFISLYWSRFNKFSEEKRDKLVTLSLLHDAHEAVVGDILPYFKTKDVRGAIFEIQNGINAAFSVREDSSLEKELKLIDMISFLYEIGQSSVRGINKGKHKLLRGMYNQQKETIFKYVKDAKFDKKKVQEFLSEMNL